ncbi:MAG: kinase/pyrophosphorylase [Alphaproteobacteria bacterium]|nr:kinase/pyrophosphorylase [Alphaproteobacteria bacterium]
METVQEEVRDARRIFTRNHWPVIDGTRKSIEEIAAIVLQLYARHKEGVS